MTDRAGAGGGVRWSHRRVCPSLREESAARVLRGEWLQVRTAAASAGHAGRAGRVASRFGKDAQTCGWVGKEPLEDGARDPVRERTVGISRAPSFALGDPSPPRTPGEIWQPAGGQTACGSAAPGNGHRARTNNPQTFSHPRARDSERTKATLAPKWLSRGWRGLFTRASWEPGSPRVTGGRRDEEEGRCGACAWPPCPAHLGLSPRPVPSSVP